MVYSLQKCKDVLIIGRSKRMKKFDIEYSTQYTPEKEYLMNNGIRPSFVKVIEGVTTFKYKKTAKLFALLEQFYAKNPI